MLPAPVPLAPTKQACTPALTEADPIKPGIDRSVPGIAYSGWRDRLPYGDARSWLRREASAHTLMFCLTAGEQWRAGQR